MAEGYRPHRIFIRARIDGEAVDLRFAAGDLTVGVERGRTTVTIVGAELVGGQFTFCEEKCQLPAPAHPSAQQTALRHSSPPLALPLLSLTTAHSSPGIRDELSTRFRTARIRVSGSSDRKSSVTRP